MTIITKSFFDILKIVVVFSIIWYNITHNDTRNNILGY